MIKTNPLRHKVPTISFLVQILKFILANSLLVPKRLFYFLVPMFYPDQNDKQEQVSLLRLAIIFVLSSTIVYSVRIAE